MRAGAFIVGPRDAAGAALMERARAIGFQFVARYRGIEAAEKQLEATPLLFFLFAAVPRLSRLKPAAAAIRYAEEPRLRFAPMMYFSPRMSRRGVDACVQMGFDDVIALPYVVGDLGERVFRHVGRTRNFFATADYFGPDRRGGLDADTVVPRGGSGEGYTRYEIVRTPDTGVTLVRVETVAASPRAAEALDAFLL